MGRGWKRRRPCPGRAGMIRTWSYQLKVELRTTELTAYCSFVAYLQNQQYTHAHTTGKARTRTPVSNGSLLLMSACFDAVKVDVRCTNVNTRQSPKYVLMYSPDGTDFMVQEVWGDRVGVGVENSKIVLVGVVPIHLFRHLCCMMYRLATVHIVI